VGVARAARLASVYALWPHMHVRGRDMTFTLQEADIHHFVNLVRELCSLSRALALDSPNMSAVGVQVEPSHQLSLPT